MIWYNDDDDDHEPETKLERYVSMENKISSLNEFLGKLA